RAAQRSRRGPQLRGGPPPRRSGGAAAPAATDPRGDPRRAPFAAADRRLLDLRSASRRQLLGGGTAGPPPWTRRCHGRRAHGAARPAAALVVGARPRRLARTARSGLARRLGVAAPERHSVPRPGAVVRGPAHGARRPALQTPADDGRPA